MGCLAALQRPDGFVDLFKLRTGAAWVLIFQLGWWRESPGDGGEIFFFWLAHSCLEARGDACRKGMSLLRLHCWCSNSDWAVAELVSLGWEAMSQKMYPLCCFPRENHTY